MASKSEVESTSKSSPSLKQENDLVEDDNDIEFPFDLSEWMVIDADDDGNEANSSFPTEDDPSTPVKSSSDQASQPSVSKGKSAANSKKSSSGRASLKNDVSTGGLASAWAECQTPSHLSGKNRTAIPDPGGKKQSKPNMKAKPENSQPSSISSSKSSFPVKRSVSSGTSVTQARKGTPEKKDSSTASSKTRMSMRTNVPDQNSKESCNSDSTKGGKTTEQQTTIKKDLSTKTAQFQNKNTKSGIAKSSVFSAQSAASPLATQAANKGVSTKTADDSLNHAQASKSSLTLTELAKKNQDSGGDKLQTSVKASESVSQQDFVKTNAKSPVNANASVSSSDGQSVTSTMKGTNTSTKKTGTGSNPVAKTTLSTAKSKTPSTGQPKTDASESTSTLRSQASTAKDTSSEPELTVAKTASSGTNLKASSTIQQKVSLPMSASNQRSQPSSVKGTSSESAHAIANSVGKTVSSAADSKTSSIVSSKTSTSGSSTKPHPLADGLTCNSSDSLSNTTIDTTSKAHKIASDTTRKHDETESSLKSVKSTVSDSGKQQTAKNTKPVLSNNKIKESDVKETKSSPTQSKTSRASDLTGGIAEAMEAGDLDLGLVGDIKVFDLDSDVRKSQKKNIPNPGQCSKKRLAHADEEGPSKKAKFEEKSSEVSNQDPKSMASKQNERTKALPTGGSDMSINKENTKRIIRRFHRTTQTVPKSLSHKLSQCSIASSTSRSTLKRQASLGVQCNVGERRDDITRLILNSDIFPVDSSIKQEVFKAVLAFDVSSLHPDAVAPGVFKYGIRIGQISQVDIDKTLLKDNFAKKADRYTLTFLEKEYGICDLLFHEEDSFVSVFNQIRRLRIGPRYLCVSVVKSVEEGDKDPNEMWDYLKATIVLDQNFDSSGYFAYYKSPIWSKPKVDEFITLSNVPEGVPLSFLSLVFPDAISVLMKDVKLKFTKRGSGVRLGMNRKNGSDVLLKLYTQVLINNNPVFLVQGLSEGKEIINKKGFSKLLSDLEKLEREKRKQKSLDSTLMAKARNIGNTKITVPDRARKTSNFPPKGDNFSRRDQAHRRTDQDAGSDLSDISELSLDYGRDDPRPFDRRGPRQPLKKFEPKKSLSISMGSKLLNRARTKMHHTQHINRAEPLRARAGDTDKRRRDPPRRTLLEIPRDMRGEELKPRRPSDSLQRSGVSDSRRPFGRGSNSPVKSPYYRTNHPNDRSVDSPTSRHGQRNQRDPDFDRRRNERTPDHLRRITSDNRSIERDMPGRRNAERVIRSHERHGSRENRSRTRDNMAFGEAPEFAHHSRRKSSDREIFLGRPEQIAINLQRSSEDLRSVLDSKRPGQGGLSPQGRFRGGDRTRHGSPGRRRPSPERQKRPRSRSISPAGRKVIIRRRSLSPRARSQRVRSKDRPQQVFPSQPSRTGRDSKPEKFVGGQDQEDKNLQNVLWNFKDDRQPPAKEENMTITKSLFVKLLTNALHEEEGGSSGKTSHDTETTEMLSRIRNQETQRHHLADDFKPSTSSRQDKRRPDFKNERGGGFEQRGPSNKSAIYDPLSTSNNSNPIRQQPDLPKPIPPPVMPPILTSSAMSFQPTNKLINNPSASRPVLSTEATRGPLAPQMGQGVWAVPPPASSFTPTMVPPPVSSNPSLPQAPNAFIQAAASMLFSRPPPGQQRPPFMPAAQGGQGSNMTRPLQPQGPGMWQNPHPGPF